MTACPCKSISTNYQICHIVERVNYWKALSEEELVLFLKQVVSCMKELIVQG